MGDTRLRLGTRPSVVLVIGVNGVGKTTTIGKLAKQLGDQGKKVLMCAGDTFRAAAADQLEIWAGRTGADVIAVADALQIPVKYIGVGEKAEDLMPFDARDFVNALL